MVRGLQGKNPRIAETAFISEAAYVVGEVEIGDFSTVWPGAVIRGDYARIVIGRYSNIEDNSVLHGGAPLTIGNEVIVGHGAVVHCRKAGNNVLIGSHATILDGAEIGDFCIVMGVPAEVKGRISERQEEELKVGGRLYAEFAQRYKLEGLGKF
jgi:carbonic anhydrase/acetyltransferase-like protein (isoleucine patch superfamily)